MEVEKVGKEVFLKHEGYHNHPSPINYKIPYGAWTEIKELISNNQSRTAAKIHYKLDKSKETMDAYPLLYDY